jgi:hypothetical protein
MRPLYLIGSILLSVGAVYAVMGVSDYEYSSVVQVPDDISYIQPEDESASIDPEDDEVNPREASWIHTKNAFDKLRGAPVKPTDPTVKKPDEVVGEYEFEVRGINILGDSKVALITAKAMRTTKSSRGRRPPRPSVSSKGTRPIKVRVGDQINETGYVVEAIEAGLVTIKDKEGLSMEVVYSLKSESAVKRGELAYKNELGRQKSFSKQNAFNDGTKPLQRVTPPGPKAPINREAEMKKRATALRAEMQRLKEIREKKQGNSKAESKSDRKYDRKKR